MTVFSQLSDIQTALNAGDITLTGLVNTYLQNIDAQAHLNAFVEVFGDEARERATLLEQKKEHRGRLYGAVIAIKDNIHYKGHRVTSASHILDKYTALYSATAIERLLAEDAIIIGRTNCDEFAMGSSNENSYYGAVKNGIDNTKVPGGSSGGSAVAVQMHMCLAALGSDTGGSIRQPAAFCGIVGLKPTYGRISRYGLTAYGSSFDQIGPMTHSIEDAALLLEVMAGADEYDSTASPAPVDTYTDLTPITSSRVANFNEGFEHTSIDTDLKKIYTAALSTLQGSNISLHNTSFQYQDYVVPTYYILTTAEASSNLARFDGIRYGYHSPNADSIDNTYIKNRSEGFGAEVKRRIMLGTFVLSAGYYDAFYTHAQKIRRLLHDNIEQIFATHDFILLPTTPSAAFGIGAKTSDPVEMYLADLFTVLANITGHPAISIPVGKTAEGLPVGLQVIGKKFDERNLLSFAKHILSLQKT